MSQAATKGIRLRHAPLAAGFSVLAALALPGLASGAPGDLDPGFGGAKHGRVVFGLGSAAGLAVQSDGKIVVVGHESQGAGFNAVVARLKADGRPDNRFGSVLLPPSRSGADTTALAQAVAVQPDGKIVVVGQVTDAGGRADFGVWRLRRSGAMDTSFDADGLVQFGGDTTEDAASAVAIDPQGRILIAGTSASVGGADLGVLRLTPTGALDSSFNRGLSFFIPTHPGTDFAQSIGVQADGNIVLGGFYEGATGNAVLRVVPGTETTQATLDTTFGGDGVADVPGTTATNSGGIAILPDGNILVLDRVGTAAGPAATVVRLSPTGSVDNTFGSPDGTGAHISTEAGKSTAHALALLPGGGVVAVGVDDSGVAFAAKFHKSGKPDLRMGPGGVKTLHRAGDLVAVAGLEDGRILAMGNRSGGTNVLFRLRGDLRPPLCGGRKATIVGTKAPDRLVGTKHADVIAGLAGPDTITGLGKGDVLCGGPGNDHLSGGLGGDHLYGGHGRDTLRGGPGRDTLVQ